MFKLLQMFMKVLLSIKVTALIMHRSILRQLFLLFKNCFAPWNSPSSPYFHLISQRHFEKGFLLSYLVLRESLSTLAKCFNNTHFIEVKSALLCVSAIEVNSACRNRKLQTSTAASISKTIPYICCQESEIRQDAQALWRKFKTNCCLIWKALSN